jgi:DNA-binding winged helix-turn-helix (wHTH) protein
VSRDGPGGDRSRGWTRPPWHPGRGSARFGPFELDARTGELRREGRSIGLQDQPLRLLQALLEQPGEIVTRDVLRQRLWPADTFVDFEHGLNAAVKRLRDALGDSADTPVFVETVPRRGYRFIAPVVERRGDRRGLWLRAAACVLLTVIAAAAVTCRLSESTRIAPGTLAPAKP